MKFEIEVRNSKRGKLVCSFSYDRLADAITYKENNIGKFITIYCCREGKRRIKIK
jgi:hypothetical protein